MDSHSTFICCLVVLCSLQITLGTHHHGGGHSNIYREQNGWGKYSFGYDIHDPWGNKNFRKEHGEFTKKGGHVVGSYGIYDAKGRLRLVKYTAGKNGFVATIKTNEPGTGDVDSAGVYFNGGDHHKGKWLYDVGTHHKDHWGKHSHHDVHPGHHGHHSHKIHGLGKAHGYIAAASELKGSSGSPRQRKYDDKGFPYDGNQSHGPVNANGFDQRGFKVADYDSSPKQRGFPERERNSNKPNFHGKHGFDRDSFQANFDENRFGEGKFGDGKLGFNNDRDGDGEYKRLAGNYPRSEEGHKFGKQSFD
ncbi:uncharacterized protein LOC107363949 [Tetranychus urticae]|uniref:Uncharacterized protein n=1 Tax=Tetranychus urticae TaxID=32264 RepID=T1KHY2_TETUR|nr:uncharacterized protein LOC107363949 [Tetranychus urticae]